MNFVKEISTIQAFCHRPKSTFVTQEVWLTPKRPRAGLAGTCHTLGLRPMARQVHTKSGPALHIDNPSFSISPRGCRPEGLQPLGEINQQRKKDGILLVGDSGTTANILGRTLTLLISKGKKATAEQILYKFCVFVETKTKKKSASFVSRAVRNVKPLIGVSSRPDQRRRRFKAIPLALHVGEKMALK